MIKNIIWLICLQLLFVFVNGEGFGVAVVGKRTNAKHPVVENLKTSDGITYTGKLRVGSSKTSGEPQEFLNVLFDTGSADLILINSNHKKECNKEEHAEMCRSAKPFTYDPSKSSTYQRTDGTFLVSYVDKTAYSGHIAYDQLEIGDGPSKLRVTATIGVADLVVNEVQFDGVFGISFGVISKFNPQILTAIECIFAQADIPPQMAYYVRKLEDDEPEGDYQGEIYFGGYNPDYVASAFSDPVPLHAMNGIHYGWEMAIKRIEIGANVIDLEGQDLDGDGIPGTNAVADTGTSITFMSPPIFDKIMSYVMPSIDYQRFASLRQFLCKDLPDHLPDIKFVLNGGAAFTLGPETYINSQYDAYICQLFLEGVKHPAIVLGNDFLQKYYTVFDYEKREMKFALAKQKEISVGSRQPGLYGKRRVSGIPKERLEEYMAKLEKGLSIPVPRYEGE